MCSARTFIIFVGGAPLICTPQDGEGQDGEGLSTILTFLRGCVSD